MEDDERFKHAKSDPVFKKARRSQKVKIDSRFAGALSDERFGLAPAPVDAYGRKVSKAEKREQRKAELAPFYQVEEEPEELKSSEEARLKTLQARARGEVEDEESEDEDDSDDEVEEEEEEFSWDAHLPATHTVEEDIDIDVETARLAVTDCDWSHVGAADLRVILESLCPVGGRVESVQIYASDYGAEQMAKEERYGPQGIFVDPNEQPEEEEEEEEEEESGESEPESEAEKEATGFDPLQLRRYELSKLRRFYAIATFDSVRCAKAAYAAGEGLELESSSTILNFSFVPTDQAFDPSRLKEQSTAASDDYEPPAQFCLAALQQTKVKCTFDEDESEFRSAKLAKIHEAARDAEKDAEEDEVDASAFLADDSDDDDRDAKKIREALGLGDVAAEGFDDDFFAAPDGEEEVIISSEPVEDQEVEEAPYVRQERLRLERRKAKKSAAKTEAAAEEVKKPLKKKKEVDNTEERDYDARKLETVEKLTGKGKLRGKRKRLRESLVAEETRSGFEFDSKDDRFRGVLDGEDDRFGVDPSAVDFKKTAAMKEILKAQTAKRSDRRKESDRRAIAGDDEPKNDADDLQALARSLSAKLAPKKAASAKKKTKKTKS